MRLDLPADQESKLRAHSRLRSLRAANDARYSLHPWPYLKEAVFTFDPFLAGAAGGGVRKYPGAFLHDRTPGCRCTEGGCDNYLHHIVNIWFATQRSVWPKSRRVVFSWTMLALHEWLARYRPGQVIALVSRKQGQNEDEGSAELIKRTHFIATHTPIEVTPRIPRKSWCRLAYPNDSVIVGIAQGARQLAQYAITAAFFDEFAFWEEAGGTYSASLPALEGGGRLTIGSSANPGFMKSLVFDEWAVSGS